MISANSFQTALLFQILEDNNFQLKLIQRYHKKNKLA